MQTYGDIIYAYLHAHTDLHRSFKWEGSPQGACWSKLTLDVRLSALNANMQQYIWIIGAIISVTVNCVLLFRAVTLPQTERLWISIKTWTCEVTQPPTAFSALLPDVEYNLYNEFPLYFQCQISLWTTSQLYKMRAEAKVLMLRDIR